MTLAKLKLNESTEIKGFCPERKELAQELQELGFIQGAKVTLVHRGLFANPLAFEIRGSVFALRKNEAEAVLV